MPQKPIGRNARVEKTQEHVSAKTCLAGLPRYEDVDLCIEATKSLTVWGAGFVKTETPQEQRSQVSSKCL